MVIMTAVVVAAGMNTIHLQRKSDDCGEDDDSEADAPAIRIGSHSISRGIFYVMWLLNDHGRDATIAIANRDGCVVGFGLLRHDVLLNNTSTE